MRQKSLSLWVLYFSGDREGETINMINTINNKHGKQYMIRCVRKLANAMEKYNKVRTIHSAMLKGGLPAKATREHRCGGVNLQRKCEGRGEGQKARVLVPEMQSDKAETWEPVKALDIHFEGNVEPLEVYEQV